MTLLHEPIIKNYNKFPDSIAVIDGDSKYTFRDLWVLTKKLAVLLNSRTEHRAKIGILLNNCIEAVYSFYAISVCSRVCVPLDVDISPRNLLYIVEDASIELIITSTKYLDKIRTLKHELSLDLLLIDHPEFNNYNQNSHNLSLDNYTNWMKLSGIKTSSTAVILYTTGTTGLRKGVKLSHRNLTAATMNINSFMRIGSWAVESLPMRLSHSFGLARMRCVFDVHGAIILENGFLWPNRILENMKLHKANGISSVPAGFVILLDFFKEQFEEISSQIKYIEIGSAFMRENHKNLLMQLCPNARICMHYGLTEASRSTFIEFSSEKDKLHTVGKPSPNVEILITGENGKKLSSNQTGEILVKGQIVMKGYLNKSDMTKEYLKNGWLHTGDLGMIDDEGYVHLLGRKKEIINIGGLKVSPGEIEEILLKYSGISEATVVGVKSSDDIFDERIKAFIVTDDDKLSIKDLEKFCLENMESYKLPDEFEIVKFLPKTSSGKIQRHLLI